MQIVRLKAQNKANVGLNPTNNTVYMSQTAGIPYVELSYVTCEDWYQNSHKKILSGIYTGGRPTSIRVRDHYPHSIGTGWCTKSYHMLIESPTSTRINVSGADPLSTAEYIPVVGNNNYTEFKETCFWGAENTLITVGDNEIANSMYYNNMEPYAPVEGDSNYYSDRMAAVGVDYPYGASPSAWTNATLNTSEQTWEAALTLNQFTMFEGTDHQQTYNYWKDYNEETYPLGLNYDPRLHAVEIEITFGNRKGRRMYYLWHVPQCWALTKAPKIEITTGSYSGPFDRHTCGTFGIGNQYDTGYTATGGTGLLELQGSDITYDNLLFQMNPVVERSFTNLLNYPSGVCEDAAGNIYVFSDSVKNIYKFDSSGNYLSSIPVSSYAYDLVCVDDNFYIAHYGKVIKYDLSGNDLLTIIDPYDKNAIAVYNGYIYFSRYGRYIYEYNAMGAYTRTLTLPDSSDRVRDFDIDNNGNIYVFTNRYNYASRIYKYDNDFILQSTHMLDLYSSYYYWVDGSIFLKDGYLYLLSANRGNYGLPDEESKIAKWQDDFTPISSKEIFWSGKIFVDSNDKIYTILEDTNLISVMDQSLNELYRIGEADQDYFTEVNTIKFGIWDTAQIKKAYAVINPVNFDPTDSSTYSEMIEYTGSDLSITTITADGMVRFKNLYPEAEEHYIYILAAYEPAGTIDTQYNYIYWNKNRNYTWFTRTPNCSEYATGTVSTNIDPTYELVTDDTEYLVSLDTFDSGIDLDNATIFYRWFDGINVFIYGNGSDGGRTKFWITYPSTGLKTNYNIIGNSGATAAGNESGIIPIGIPDNMNYENSIYAEEKYGWNLGSLGLVIRTLKDGSYLTCSYNGCQVYNTYLNHTIERTAA